MSEQLPKVAIAKSIKFQVEKDKKYYWCSCGMSANQPFCDGSHVGTNFSPIEYIATDDRLVGFCGCKNTKNPPLCDGSHHSLQSVENK